MVDGVLNLAPMVRARGLRPWARSIKRLPARFLRVVSPTHLALESAREQACTETQQGDSLLRLYAD
jgi:hypothetical protein